MFNLSPNHAVDRLILTCDFIRYTPLSLNFVNGENNQTFFDIPREGISKIVSKKDSYLELGLNVFHTAGAHG